MCTIESILDERKDSTVLAMMGMDIHEAEDKVKKSAKYIDRLDPSLGDIIRQTVDSWAEFKEKYTMIMVLLGKIKADKDAKRASKDESDSHGGSGDPEEPHPGR